MKTYEIDIERREVHSARFYVPAETLAKTLAENAHKYFCDMANGLTRLVPGTLQEFDDLCKESQLCCLRRIATASEDFLRSPDIREKDLGAYHLTAFIGVNAHEAHKTGKST